MKTIVFAALLLLGLTFSCGNGQGEAEIKETANSEIRKAPAEATEAFDASSTVFSDNQGTFFNDSELINVEDTLVYKGYLFASYPIPDTVKARMQGKSMKDKARISYDQLRYLTLPYYDFDSLVQKGELVCNQSIAHDLLCVFRDLFSEQYPICSIRLVDDFDADDEASMQANNSSCFNYRTIAGTNILSQHAFGMAVDINPLQNPCIRGSRIQPETAMDYVDRTKDFLHKIDEDDFCKQTFTSYGFTWGGDWKRMKDYQHFEKRK